MAKYVAKDIVVEVETATPATFAALPQVSSIDLPQDDTEEVEVTTLDNANTREFLQGFTDGGECGMELIFDPATHVTGANSVVSLKNSGVTRTWRVRLPTAMDMRYKFDAYVKKASLGSITPGKAVTMAVTLRVSGAAGEFEAITP